MESKTKRKIIGLTCILGAIFLFITSFVSLVTSSLFIGVSSGFIFIIIILLTIVGYEYLDL